MDAQQRFYWLAIAVFAGVLAGSIAGLGLGLYAIVGLLAVFGAVWLCRDIWSLSVVSMLVTTTLSVSKFAGQVPALELAKVVTVAILFVVATYEIRSVRSRRRSLVQIGGVGSLLRPYLTSAILFVAIAVFSITRSGHPVVSGTQVIMLVMLFSMIPAAIARFVKGEVDRDLALIHGFLVATIVIGFFTSPGGIGASAGRYSGLYVNPNTLALICTVALPISVYLWRSGRGRPLALLGMAAASVALILTQSRTALIALIIGLVFLLVIRPTLRKMLLATGLTISTVVAYLLWSSRDDGQLLGVLGRLNQDNSGVSLLSGREGMWIRSFEAWQLQPIAGFGYGTAPYGAFTGRLSAVDGFERGIAANSYIQTLIETGIIGASALVALLTVILIAAVKATRRGNNSPFAYFVIVALCVQFTESPLFGAGQAYPWVFWYVATVLVMVADRPRDLPGYSAPQHAHDFKEFGAL